MKEEIRTDLLRLVSEAHSMVEKEYLNHPAKKGEQEWVDKRRLLLADLSLHMAQAGVQKTTDVKLIMRYLYSLLTICDDFIPETGLKHVAQKLLENGLD